MIFALLEIAVNPQRVDIFLILRTVREGMKDYSDLKSSREALLRKAGFQEGHNIFNSGSLDQIREFQVEGDGNDSASHGDQTG